MNRTHYSYQPSRFSQSGFRAFAQYNYPLLRWQIIFYLLISLCCGTLILLPVGDVAQVSIFTVTWSALPLMFVFSPLVFARNGDSRKVERQIPVSAGEKLAFYLIYLCIVVGVSVYAIPELCLWLYTKIPSVQTESIMDLLKIRYSTYAMLTCSNIMSVFAALMTCLCVVLRARSNRIIKAVISVFGFQIVIGLMGAFYGAYIALTSGIADGMSGIADGLARKNPITEESVGKEIVEKFTMEGNWFVVVTLVVVTVYSAYMVWLVYKTLSRGGKRI